MLELEYSTLNEGFSTTTLV